MILFKKSTQINADVLYAGVVQFLLCGLIVFLVVGAMLTSWSEKFTSFFLGGVMFFLVSVLMLILGMLASPLIKKVRYRSPSLTKKVIQKFPEITQKDFKIKDQSLTGLMEGEVSSKNGKVTIYGYSYLLPFKRNPKLLEENYRYIIELLNENKIIK